MNNDDKAFIRHEILNIITLINFLLTDSNLEESKKEQILDQLKLVSLFVAQREVILGKRKKFSKRKIDLNEILEMLDLLLADKAKKGKVKISIGKTNMMPRADRDVLLNGLEYILLCLMSISKKISVEVNEKKKKLLVKYESDQTLKMSKEELVKYLRKGPESADIFCRMGTHLMNMSGLKTNFKKGMVEIVL